MVSNYYNRAEKTFVLSQLIQKTNAQEMKWIIMIILKGLITIYDYIFLSLVSFFGSYIWPTNLISFIPDLKLGTSEKSIFHEFHPDAEDLFNVTCDLKLVCEKLRDPSRRHKRQV